MKFLVVTFWLCAAYEVCWAVNELIHVVTR